MSSSAGRAIHANAMDKPRLRRLRSKAVLFVIALLFPTIFGNSLPAIADESTESKPALQKRLPDGRLLRSIGIADSQKFELIPQNFSPVKRDQLVESIGRWNESSVETPNNRLQKSEYVVRVTKDLLSCRLGFLEVASKPNELVNQSLGKVSFAVLNNDLQNNDDPVDTEKSETGREVSAKLVSLADGTLIARFQSNSQRLNRIPMRWEDRGFAGSRGYTFDLEFPETLETRFLFCVDAGVDLESDQGVLHLLDEVPDSLSASESGLLEAGKPVQWYALDAGGLSRIRLQTYGQTSEVPAEAIVVRRNAVEYSIDSSGLYFIQRMELVLPVGVTLPDLRVLDARLTSIKVNASEASFVRLWSDANSSSDGGVYSTDYRVLSPPGAIGQKESHVTLTLMGQSEWDDICKLPLAGLVVKEDLGIPVVDACISDEARVTMAPVGRIVDWELPDGWQRQSATDTKGLSVETAIGTSLLKVFESTVKAAKSVQGSPVEPHPAWSVLRLSIPPVYQVRDLWLRSEIDEAGINCEASFSLLIGNRSMEPLQFLIQEDWEIENLVFPTSGRVVETPLIDERIRLLTVWPELEDIEQSLIGEDPNFPLALRFQINGKRVVRSGGSRMVVPATWMARACDNRARKILSDDFTAAVIPPSDMNWSGDTAMKPHRVERTRLTEKQQEFFKGEDRTTLFFKPRHRQIDVLGLESPSVDYQASLSMQIRRQEGEIVEQCFVKISSLGRGLESLIVQTGPAKNRPAFRWMIPGQSDALSTTLAASDVELTDVDGQGIYTVNVSGLDFSSRPLMAYRSYPAKDFSLQLPSIPSAASGTSELYIGAGLEITSKSKGVQLVPGSASPMENVSTPKLAGPGPGIDKPARIEVDQVDGLHLRYDSMQKPSIGLAVADHEASINLITHSQTKIIASSRGSDRVETTVLAAISNPLTIRFDHELQLASVTRDGDPVDFSKLSQFPLVLPPRMGADRGKPEVIELKWNRNQAGFHAIRACRMPRVDIDAAVLKHDYHLVASADTFAPRSLLKGNSESARYRTLEMSPGERTFLIRRNFMLAIGWLIAMINFICFWVMMKRSQIVVVVFLAVFSVSVLLWWPWRMPIIGWFIVPLIAAAMLVTAQSWANGIRQSSTANSQSNAGGMSRSNDLPPEDPTTDFSWESILRGWIIAIAVISPASSHSVFQGSRLHAQSNPLSQSSFPNPANPPEQSTSQGVKSNTNGDLMPQPNTTRIEDAASSIKSSATPVNVLIPMGSDNQPAGEFVYVPDTLHKRLFDNQTQSGLLSPAFASAKYEFKIRHTDTTSTEFVAANLVATYELEFPKHRTGDFDARTSTGTQQCLIPLSHVQIEKIQLIGTEATSLGFSPRPQGGTIVTLPNNEKAKIQVELRLAGSRQGPWVRFELGIPSVSASRIEVESEFDLRVLRIGGVTGRLIEEADLRRWSEMLGPTQQLDVSFRIDPRLDAVAIEKVKPLQRRYWVSSGRNTTTIDCEVDPPEAFAAGEVFQFVIRDLAMPILMSPDWRLVDTSVYATRRRRVSVMSVCDSPGPIQLLWKLSNHDEWALSPESNGGRAVIESIRTSQDFGDNAVGFPRNHSIPIRIPEVIASSLGENAPAWIALRCLDTLSFDPLPSGLIEPLSVDQFLAGWSGYRGRIDRAFVALDEIPTAQLRRKPSGSIRIEDRHRLRVSPRRLELSYQADVTPETDTFQPYLLTVPLGVDLVDLYVDEVRQIPFYVDSNGRRHVVIERQERQGDPFSVSAFAIGDLSPGDQFKPPVMVLSLSSEQQTKASGKTTVEEIKPIFGQDRVSSYTVSRTNDSFIQIVEPFAMDATRSVAALTAESLADGYLPVATWKASSAQLDNSGFPPTLFGNEEPDQDNGLVNRDVPTGEQSRNLDDDFWQGNWGGIFRVQQRADRFDCDQLLTLNRLDRDWQVSSQIHFPGPHRPDYIDIEIPTRWCESLEISPATVWSRQPSTNPSHQIVRVRRDPSHPEDQPLLVRGLLSQIDDGRVSVPTIRVLGLGTRSVFVQVPERLTNERVQWRPIGVEETPLPRFFTDGGSKDGIANQPLQINDVASEDSVVAYRVTRRKWSIDLAPLPELSLQPIATTQDNQVFPAEDSICVITTWDISPGSLEKVQVNVPADAECLGAWSGGVTVSAVTAPPLPQPSISNKDSVAGPQKQLEIPLSLSQLPQSVMLLIRVPITRFKRSDYVPSLVGIPVTQAWLAIYQPQTLGARTEAGLNSEVTKLRNLSLARSAVESIELAVDIVAERSSDEVVPWLAPWVYRYLQLAAASGRTAQFTKNVMDDNEADATELLSHSIEQFDAVQWKLLDRRIAVYANRFVPGLQAEFDQNVPRQNADSQLLETESNRKLSGSEIQYRSFLGDEAILSSTSAPGFRLAKVLQLHAPNHAPSLGAPSGNDHQLKRMLGNVLTLILVVGLLVCLKPLKPYVQTLIVHPTFWLAALGVAGLFVAPAYVALSLILVAISMPWFPAGMKS